MKGILIAVTALLLLTVGVGGTSAAADTAPSQCGTPPAVTLAVAPAFPSLPWKARIGADQWIQVEVNELGDVADVTMEAEKNPSLGFGNAASAAARQWKFEAASGCAPRRARLLFRFEMPVSKPEQVGIRFRPPYEVDIAVQAFTIDASSTQ